MGLAISFSSLQDTTTTQNNISKKIWESPLKGKIMIFIMASMSMGFILIGMKFYFGTHDNGLKELSIGLIVLGIGLIGLLKTAIEMFEHHRMDRQK